jgi:ATP-binding cassette subfamily B protein
MREGRPGDFALYLRLLREARPYWGLLVVIGALDLVRVPLVLLQPWPMKIIVDNVLGSQPLPSLVASMASGASPSWQSRLAIAIGLLVAVALLDKLQNTIGWLLKVDTGERLVLRFRAKIFHHLQRLSLVYHDAKGTADSIYRIEYDAEAIRTIAMGFMPYVVSVFTLVGMLFVTMRLDWPLALITLAGSPLSIALISMQRDTMRTRWTEIYEHNSRAFAVIHEALSASRVVKAFGREDREHARFLQHGNVSAERQLAAARVEAGLDAGIGLIFTLSTAAVLVLGVLHIREGRITLGELLVFMAYAGHLQGPLLMLTRISADLQSSLVNATRTYAVLDLDPDIVDRPDARPLVRARGDVTMRDVSFAYAPGDLVLHNVSLEIPAGARVGISGPTGAGKTTLVNLLPRFYDPVNGQVLLDGVDVREYRIADLRNQFGIVLQEPVLFSASIGENIAYARPEASEDEIVAAAKAANAHEFITALPEGYAALVGERGMRLSGGERQRVSLARAFLKNAPLLILDEPTSSVDLATEAEIMRATERLMEGRTTFMIAHRMGTLERCDMRIELAHGRVVSIVKGISTGDAARAREVRQ